MSPSTEDRIRSIVADRMSRSVDSVTSETNLVADLGCDSLDLAEIAMDIEDAFGLRYNTLESVATPITVGTLSRQVSELVAARTR